VANKGQPLIVVNRGEAWDGTPFGGMTTIEVAPAPATPRGKRAKVARKHRTGPKYLTPDQLAALFKAIAAAPASSERQRLRDLAIFEISYGRGLRACEVGKHTIDDVREERGGLFVMKVKRAKGSRGGEYRLNDREKKALRAWLRVRGKDAGALFPSRIGRAIGVAALDDLIKSYGAAAGLPREVCHFHVLRHSCGMRLAELDVPIEEAQDHMGHVSITNTGIYYQISNRRRRERDERLRDRW
jgi:integrase